MRYEGAVHCAGLMWREEGLRGLYRGYFAFLGATAIYWAIVPLVSELALQRSPISGNYQDRTGELLDEVTRLKSIQQGKEASVLPRRTKED